MVWKKNAAKKKKKKKKSSIKEKKTPKELNRDRFKNKKTSSSPKEQSPCKVPSKLDFFHICEINHLLCSIGLNAKVRTWAVWYFVFMKRFLWTFLMTNWKFI